MYSLISIDINYVWPIHTNFCILYVCIETFTEGDMTNWNSGRLIFPTIKPQPGKDLGKTVSLKRSINNIYIIFI